MSKRRGKAARSAMNSKLVVRHRDMTEDEVLAQVNSMRLGVREFVFVVCVLTSACLLSANGN